MAEENSSQEKPDYKHFKQEEAPREPEGPQSVEGETALDSEGGNLDRCRTGREGSAGTGIRQRGRGSRATKGP